VECPALRPASSSHLPWLGLAEFFSSLIIAEQVTRVPSTTGSPRAVAALVSPPMTRTFYTISPSTTSIHCRSSPEPPAVDLTIIGNGDTIERSTAAPALRLFDVADGASLTLDQLTLQNGWAFEENGGAIVNRGTLTVSNSVCSRCMTSIPNFRVWCDDDSVRVASLRLNPGQQPGTAGHSRTRCSCQGLDSGSSDGTEGLGAPFCLSGTCTRPTLFVYGARFLDGGRRGG